MSCKHTYIHQIGNLGSVPTSVAKFVGGSPGATNREVISAEVDPDSFRRDRAVWWRAVTLRVTPYRSGTVRWLLTAWIDRGRKYLLIGRTGGPTNEFCCGRGYIANSKL